MQSLAKCSVPLDKYVEQTKDAKLISSPLYPRYQLTKPNDANDHLKPENLSPTICPDVGLESRSTPSQPTIRRIKQLSDLSVWAFRHMQYFCIPKLYSSVVSQG